MGLHRDFALSTDVFWVQLCQGINLAPLLLTYPAWRQRCNTSQITQKQAYEDYLTLIRILRAKAEYKTYVRNKIFKNERAWHE